MMKIVEIKCSNLATFWPQKKVIRVPNLSYYVG